MLNNPGSNTPGVPIGEGSPGLVWRFQGNADPQLFTDVDPTQFFLFAGADSQPDLDPPFMGPGWLDFEFYLPVAAWGTSTVTCRLLTQLSGVPISTKRLWSELTAGSQEGQGMLFVDRMLWFAGASVSRFLLSFRIELTIEDDGAPDIVVDSPNAYAKFTQYVAPVVAP